MKLRSRKTRMLNEQISRVLACVFLCGSMLLFNVVGVQAQTTIWNQDFNIDNDGSEYNLVGRYFQNVNGMFGTAPGAGLALGRPMFVAYDTGAELFDGSATPARRVSTFIDSRLSEGGGFDPLNDDGWQLLENAVGWASDGGSALNITYLRDANAGVDRFFDDEFIFRLEELGHTVNQGTTLDVASTDADLYVLGTTNNEQGNADNGFASLDPSFRNLATPIVSSLYHGTDDLGLGGDRGDDRNSMSIEILNDTHPITSGFARGELTVVPDDVSPVRLAFVDRDGSSSIAPGGVILAGEPGRDIADPLDFTNFEGAGYLRTVQTGGFGAARSGEPRRFDSLGSINLSNVTGAEFQLLAGAQSEVFENDIDTGEPNDFLRIFGQDGEEGTPELIGEFVPDDFGDLVNDPLDATIVLGTELQEVSLPIPAGIANSSDLRILVEIQSTGGDKGIALDNFRIVGEAPSCNPDSMGDLDGSGDVAFADFLILSANFGMEVADHTAGDIDCSGDVAFADFLVLSANFGQTVGGAQSVPEPSALALLSIAVLCLGTLRKQRRA